MTNDEMRIAIAEACGGIDRDYPNDLNAMHEAEKVLSPSQVKEYLNHLGYLTPFENANGKGTWPVVCATIAQRREAFLRTLNKWKEA